MRIQCPACFIDVEAPYARGGDKGQCASCGADFIVPEGSDDDHEIIVPDKLPLAEIDCPVCSTVVRVSEENIGKKGRCERCDSKFIVPENAGNEVEILERGQLPISELNCPVCSTVVRVSWVNIGKKGRCEGCDSKFVVPECPGGEVEILESCGVPSGESLQQPEPEVTTKQSEE
ncbi:MAG: hypothetical protein GY899_14490 [Verrucomicrobiaceae bacterium]|nr:hypothetical protein [Verrucomicrobiaceae bacterium]